MKSKLDRAIEFATKAHEGQTRWGGEPYITHSLAVMEHLRDDLGITDEDTLCAAVLHDVVEDTPVCIQDISKEFGRVVGNMVVALTQMPEETYGEYIQEMVDQGNRGAIIVKLADLWHNSSDLGKGSSHRQRKEKYEMTTLYLKHVLREQELNSDH